jgi:hypothetical protein
MLERIVSGGQTGVDRAALDVALSRGLQCGGWCPKGRLAEDGRIPPSYPLRETPSPAYEERTAWNVRDSDGTLVLTWGAPSDGTAFTIALAKEMLRPHLVTDLANNDAAAEQAAQWLRENPIAILNVAGPRASKSPQIYEHAVAFLHSMLDALAPA